MLSNLKAIVPENLISLAKKTPKISVGIVSADHYPVIESDLIPFNTLTQLEALLRHSNDIIPRGMGRCYGDSALNERVVSTRQYNQIQSFDCDTGIIECDSGLTLDTKSKYSFNLNGLLIIPL